MKFRKLFIVLTIFFNSTLAETAHEAISTEDHRETLSIAIYNDNLALINETRTLLLVPGLNRIAFNDVSAQIRPETAQITASQGTPFNLIEQNFDYDLLSPAAMLNKAVGKEITVITTNPATGEEKRETATVLANNDGPVLQYSDRIETGLNGRLAFNTIPDNLSIRPTLSVLLSNSEQSRRNLQLTYLTSGFSWNADYTAMLSQDETRANISGWITLNNQSGTSFKNASIQLIAGNINQITTEEAYMVSYDMAENSSAGAFQAAPVQEAFGDYHLYTLPFKTSVLNQQTKQVALLSKNNIPILKEYQLAPPHFYYQTQTGENIKARVYYHLENKTEHQLGLPLPKGVFRVYKNNTANEALLVGEDTINHTAVNEKMALSTGEAFDISMTRQQSDYHKTEKLLSTDKRHTNSFIVTFNNAKDEAVTVTYYEYPGLRWTILKSSHQHSKENATTAKWLINIPAKGSVTLTFTIQTDE